MLIDYQNVNIYHEDVKVLEGVNFHADEGEFIYLIGKVGSGKSSLLETIYMELDIKEAEKAEVLGYDVLNTKRKEVPILRKMTGIIFQNFQLLSDRTVYKNLRFVLRATGWKDKKRIDERIDETLTDVGMVDAKNKMPHELSGGEQQRIAIARAILNKPKLIVADEPTGNLDPDTASQIVELLRSICQTGTAVIMSTHNMPMLDKYPGIVYQCKDCKLNEITKDFNKISLSEEEE
ncbi:cell division ATP-binding protein FtsE [Xylanibacter oryzae]|jgi:cell division transport system ATP-binding protein|uniref:cell division ATP-binding protein FtsE n=1 Tax=Xylanibacter oryzae TaxID=185293 RepID=UPI0004B1097F|nr:ATP-binding cassette domain-containing protein [Xylanibacter oryzae]